MIALHHIDSKYPVIRMVRTGLYCPLKLSAVPHPQLNGNLATGKGGFEFLQHVPVPFAPRQSIGNFQKVSIFIERRNQIFVVTNLDERIDDRCSSRLKVTRIASHKVHGMI